MSPHTLIPWSRDKSEEDEACGGVLWPLPLPASPSPAHSPQNHIYFALTRWAVLSCWSVWRETDPRRKDRHLTPADRWGTGRHRHTIHTVWRPCKTVKKVSKGNKGVDCVGVCDIQASAGCEKASGASVCSEEVAAPRWLTGRLGSWSPPPPPVSTNQKRTSETPLTRANTPAMLNMRVSSILVWLLLSLACVGGRVGVWASEFPDRECCDSAPPPPPHYHTTTSTTPVPIVRTLSTTTTSPPPSFFPIASIAPTGKSLTFT